MSTSNGAAETSLSHALVCCSLALTSLFDTKMLRPYFFISLIFVFSTQYTCESQIIVAELIFKVFEKAKTAYEIGELVYKNVKDVSSKDKSPEEYLENLSADLQKVLTLDNKIFENSKQILEMLRSAGDRYLLTNKMDSISTSMGKMENNFNSFLDYKDSIKTGQVNDLVRSYVNSTLKRSNSEVIQILENIQSHISSHAVTGGDATKSGILRLMLNNLQGFPYMCNRNKSMNMILYDIYKGIRNTEVAGYTIVLFAYDVLKMTNYPKTEYEMVKYLVDKQFIREEGKINAAFKNAMQMSSRAVWTCDPKNDEYETWTSLNDNIRGYGRIYFNIEPVKSEIEKSMVVTGARFKRQLFLEIDGKKAVEIFIEIQQGKLLDNGTIDATTLKWKDNSSVAKPRRIGFVPGHTEFSLWAQDFYDILDGQYPVVLTGLGLKEQMPGRFGLQAYGSPVVPPSDSPIKIVDKFIAADSFVIPENPSQENGRFIHVKDPYTMESKSEPILDLHNTDSSNLADKSSDIIKRLNANVKFSTSKNKNDKMIVPFLELADAVTNPPMPMSGAGLYYKTTKGYAGYIGIELLTLSLETHIPEEIKT